MNSTTPDNNIKYIWKNIISTTNLNEANYVVCLGGLNKKLNFPLNKIIILQMEPLVLNKFKIENELSFPYTKLNHAWTHPQFTNMNYDQIKNITYKKCDKNLSTITTMKLHTELAKKGRRSFIQNFCKKYPNVMDVYGAKWNNSLGSNYNKELGFHSQVKLKQKINIMD